MASRVGVRWERLADWIESAHFQDGLGRGSRSRSSLAPVVVALADIFAVANDC
jgi:hypothetical protein